MIKSIFNLALPVGLGLIVGCGGGSSSNILNVPPVSIAGEAISATENDVVQLIGGGKDVDGKIVSYKWSQTSGKKVELTNASSQLASFVALGADSDLEFEFTLTVTDDKGATGTDSVKVTAKPAADTDFDFNLQGKVLAENIMDNAFVVVTVGDLTFETVTDSLGEYSLQIIADKSYASKLVKISAHRAGQDEFVKLVSSGINLRDMKRRAGQDAIVEASEYFGSHISYVTTAIAAMAQSENDAFLLTDKREINDFLTGSHPVDNKHNIVHLAAAARYFVDFPEARQEYALSADSSVYDFLMNKSQRERFLASAGVLVGQADKVNRDLEARYNVTVDKMKSFLFKNAGKPRWPEFYFGHLNGALPEGMQLSFNYDGSGEIKVSETVQPFTWSNESDFVVTFNSEPVYEEEVKLNFSGDGTVKREVVLNALTLKLVADVGRVDFVNFKLDWSYRYPESDNQESVAQVTEDVAILFNDTMPISAQDLIGTRSIPLGLKLNVTEVTNRNSLRAGLFSFSEGGVVQYIKPQFEQLIIPGLDINSGTWALSKAGVLSMSFENYTFEVKSLGKNYYAVTTDYSLSDLNKFNIGLSEAKNEQAVWNTNEIAGRYMLSNGMESSLISTIVELNENNTGRYIRSIPLLKAEDPLQDTLVEELTWSVSGDKLEIIGKRMVPVPEISLPSITIENVATSGVTLPDVLVSQFPWSLSSHSTDKIMINTKRVFDLMNQGNERYYTVEHEMYRDPREFGYESVQISSGVWVKLIEVAAENK